MATHDYVIANGTGAAVRSDLNGALAAIVSNNSSATEPATMYAYQWWPDTTTGLLKIRNSANSGWVTIGTLASTNLGLLPVAGGTMTGVLAVTAGTSALPGIAVSGDLNTGIYSPGSDTVALVTGGAQRTTVDSSGRLLVGTSSSSSNTRAVFQGASADGTGGCIVRFTRGDSSPADGGLLCALAFGDSGHTEAATINAARDGGTWTSGSSQPTRLVFSTTADGAASPTERLRIASTGQSLWGTTSTTGNAFASTATFGLAIDPGNGQILNCSNGAPSGYFNRTGSDGSLFVFNRNGTEKGNIAVTTIATTYNSISDYRLKENVTIVSDGITRLLQLRPSRFNFIADPDQTVDGFLAHEAQAVVPECVTGEKDAVDDNGNPVYQGIDQSKLVPLLTAALQEAIAKIEALETRLSALEAA